MTTPKPKFQPAARIHNPKPNLHPLHAYKTLHAYTRLGSSTLHACRAADKIALYMHIGSDNPCAPPPSVPLKTSHRIPFCNCNTQQLCLADLTRRWKSSWSFWLRMKWRRGAGSCWMADSITSVARSCRAGPPLLITVVSTCTINFSQTTTQEGEEDEGEDGKRPRKPGAELETKHASAKTNQ